MCLYIGEYNHTIDTKGRVILPAKFRELLGEQIIITKGLDGCLAGYHIDEWRILEDKIKQLPNAKSRNLKRFLFSSASNVPIDKQGRILIAQNLRGYAGLEKEIMITGTSSNIEIWDKQKWEDLCSELTPESIEEAMNELEF